MFSGGELEIIPTENEHVLGFVRTRGADRALMFANFSEAPQMILLPRLETQPIKAESLIHGTSNLLSDQTLQIAPLDFLIFLAKQS